MARTETESMSMSPSMITREDIELPATHRNKFGDQVQVARNYPVTVNIDDYADTGSYSGSYMGYAQIQPYHRQPGSRRPKRKLKQSYNPYTGKKRKRKHSKQIATGGNMQRTGVKWRNMNKKIAGQNEAQSSSSPSCNEIISLSAPFLFKLHSKNDSFVCKLCLKQGHYASLHSHLGSKSHLKLLKDTSKPYFCQDCCILCQSEATYKDHLEGKKHSEYVQQSAIRYSTPFTSGEVNSYLGSQKWCLGSVKDTLTPNDNIEEVFLDAKGPILGLEYALVVFTGPNQTFSSFDCTLCGVSVDVLLGWKQHFQSLNHVLKVLEYDYVAECNLLSRLGDDFTNPRWQGELWRIAVSIENSVGRPIHMVRKQIMTATGSLPGVVNTTDSKTGVVETNATDSKMGMVETNTNDGKMGIAETNTTDSKMGVVETIDQTGSTHNNIASVDVVNSNDDNCLSVGVVSITSKDTSNTGPNATPIPMLEPTTPTSTNCTEEQSLIPSPAVGVRESLKECLDTVETDPNMLQNVICSLLVTNEDADSVLKLITCLSQSLLVCRQQESL